MDKDNNNNNNESKAKLVSLKDINELLNKELNAPDTFIITDENLKRLYPDLLKFAYAIKPGEDSKNLTTVEEIIREMLKCNCNRSTTIIAVGGGVVGDISGLCAALFMRGIAWVSMPTSLLAIVDSGIGGKTGVNLDDIKNIIGAFYAPAKCFVSTHWLQTLPEREWICGFGEIIKTCLLDKKVFEFLNQNFERMLKKEQMVIEQLVGICGQIKMAIVKEDFKETGKRRILNVGHTIGHALEALDSHKLTHGEYVMKGILAEMNLIREKVDNSFYYTVRSWISAIMGDVSLGYGAEVIANLALNDKKNINSGKIVMMIPVEAGVISAVEISKEELITRLNKDF